MKKKGAKQTASYVRTFVFGVEDSLVSTVGLLSGIAVGGMDKPQIILTGVVLLFVEAFSMGVGSLISEQSAEEYVQHREVPITNDIINSAIMFVSYFLFGLVPLAPYMFLAPEQALPLSIVDTLAALFLLGVVGAMVFKINILRNGLRTLLLGGAAIAIGILAASWLQSRGY